MDTVKNILGWFEAAVPEPTRENKCTQLGCHFEEIAEFVESIMRGSNLRNHLDNRAIDFKTCQPLNLRAIELVSESETRSIEMLDALCDGIVTAIGIAHMMGWDIEGALEEVSRSNYSKFESGQPVFHENGKIKKGANYTPPNLDKFVQKQKKGF